VLCLLAGILALAMLSGTAQAAWWNTDYSRCKVVTLNISVGNFTNYTAKVNVTYDSDMQSDFDDIRFISGASCESGVSSLGQYLVNKTDSQFANYEVMLPAINTTVLMYYGNSSVSSYSNRRDANLFYDNFSEAGINTTLWYRNMTNGTTAVHNDYLSIQSGATTDTGERYCTNRTWPTPLAVEFDFATQVTADPVWTSGIAFFFQNSTVAWYLAVVSIYENAGWKATVFNSNITADSAYSNNTWYHEKITGTSSIVSVYTNVTGSMVSKSSAATGLNTPSPICPQAFYPSGWQQSHMHYDNFIAYTYSAGALSYSFGSEESRPPVNTTCNSCSDCETKLQAALSGDTILMNQSITQSGTHCIDWNGQNNMTLDCAGYSITNPTNQTGSMLYIPNGNYNTIKNCVMDGNTWSNYGIDIDGILPNGVGNNITNNTIRKFGSGIMLSESDQTRIYSNIISQSVNYGITYIILNPNTNALLYNNIFNNTENILNSSIANAGGWAFNITQASQTNIIGGNLSGGNYWALPNGSGYSQTCANSNNDSFCDVPYDPVGRGRYDFLPLTSNYTHDTTPPIITIHSPQNITYGTTNIALQVFANESISTWWYKLNGGTNTTFTPNTTITAIQGSNSIIAYANDTAGNIGASSISFFVDMTAPIITIYSPLATAYGTQSIYINVSADEAIDTWWYSLNGGSDQPFTPNTTALFINGTNNLTVFANDTLDNIGFSNVSFVVNIPAVSYLISPNDLYNLSSPYGLPQPVSFNCTGMNDVNLTNITLYIGNIPNETAAASGIWDFATFNKTFNVGNHNWTCQACDVFDACSFAVPTRLFSIYDARPPNITIYSPETLTYNNLTQPLQASADEAIDSWWYSINGGADSPFTPNSTVPSAEGLNNLTVFANDTAGNIGFTSMSFAVDTSLPSLAIISPANITYHADAVMLNISAGNHSAVWFSFDASLNTSYNATIFITNLTDGSHLVFAWANNTFGDEVQDSVVFTVDTTIPNPYDMSAARLLAELILLLFSIALLINIAKNALSKMAITSDELLQLGVLTIVMAALIVIVAGII
jgi:hypothetical protein